MKTTHSLRDRVLRELYMLTGKVCKDVDYLYYLLVKDGTMFSEDKGPVEIVKEEQTVDDFKSWFENL